MLKPFLHAWLITDAAFVAMLDRYSVAEHAGLLDMLGGASQEAPGISSIDNGIATIDVAGPLMQAPGPFERIFFGASDLTEIGDAVEAAAADPAVRGIFLNIDSPGGTVTGTPEVAAAVREAARTKHVAAFTGGLMASAAYWIGSQADVVYATPSARVGSIGVIQTLVDRSQQLAKNGVKVEVITAGKYKAAGHPATSLTDDQRAMLEAQVQEIHQEFMSAVNSRSRSIAPEDMQGQDFSGKVAATKKLVSGLANSKAQALARFRARIG